jgi:hypothetical protein
MTALSREPQIVGSKRANDVPSHAVGPGQPVR